MKMIESQCACFKKKRWTPIFRFLPMILLIFVSFPVKSQSPPCSACNDNTISVNANVTINLGTHPFTYTGDPVLKPFFTFDTSGITPDKWKVIFDLGNHKLLVNHGTTITVSQVNGYSPGIVIRSACDVEIATGAHILVSSADKNAGDIVFNVSGNIIVHGEVSNSVTKSHGKQGAIIISSGGIRIESTGLLQDIGIGFGNTISLKILLVGNCGSGDVFISGLVKAYAKGNEGDITLNRPNIEVESLNGNIEIDANTVEPLYDEFLLSGARYDIWGGLLSWVGDNVNPGKVVVHAKGNITVNGHGSDPTGTVRKSFGAVAAIGTASDAPGGLVDIRALEGQILGNNRAFDVSGRNRLSTNFAHIILYSKNDIVLSRPGGNNNFNPVVDASGPGAGDKGGWNELRSFSGKILIGINALVSAAVPSGTQGVNNLTSCLGIFNNGSVQPAAIVATSCSPASPTIGASSTVSITQTDKDLIKITTTLVYPNPSKQSVNVMFSSAENRMIQLTDISGRIIRLWTCKQPILTLAALKPGTYILHVITLSDNKNENHKIVVIR